MLPVFRIILLLCIATIIKIAYRGFLDVMGYDAKPFKLFMENPNSTSSKSTIDLFKKLVTVSDTGQSEDVLNVINSDTNLDELAERYPDVRTGGWYTPPNGKARERVAIIVPYRHRQENLNIFLKYMHPFLIKQQIEYRVIVVEQEGNFRRFNRGKLLNVGFLVSRKLGSWQCFICHDVDLLPLDPRIRYQCSTGPLHMSAIVTHLNNTAPSFGFGGVTAVTEEQFTKANGYSNQYWGWGGEDDDMHLRLQIYYNVSQCNNRCRYVMLPHSPSELCPERLDILFKTRTKFRKDGLSSLEYVVTKIELHPLYTHIVANIDKMTLDDTIAQNRFVAAMLFGDKFI